MGLHETQKESELIPKSEILLKRNYISHEKNNLLPESETATKGRDWTPDSEICSKEQEKFQNKNVPSLKRDKDQCQNSDESLTEGL